MAASDQKSATQTKADDGRVGFDDAPAGGLPPGFVTGEAGTRGTPARWEVQALEGAPSSPNVFAVAESANKGANFQVALHQKGPRLLDVDVEVSVLARGGVEDRGGGVVFRATSPGDYYSVRWNPVEGNFRVFVVVSEERTKLLEVAVEAEESQWHTVRAVAQGTHIEAYFDGELLLEIDDSRIHEAGMVGLWTKGDALTAFDDLRVSAP